VLPNLPLDSTEEWCRNRVKWDPSTKQIVISATGVPAKDGKTNHNYTIRLSLQDVSALITILGHTGTATDAEKLRDHLCKQIPALVKLLACATGIVPTPMNESKK
jgi:hypothetical protein